MVSGKKKFSDNPVVSIVIPTFNSEKILPLCLQSIKDQTYPNIEVIVIDNYSRDDTAQIAKKFGTRLLLLASERSSARNLGAKEAQGSFIFFLDSDMELTPTVVEECISVCLHKSVDAVNVYEVSVGGGFIAECRKIEREMRIGSNVSEAPRFFRREVFDSVDGYDENLVSGEDFDLRRRIEDAGYRIGRCKAEIRHHEGEMSMRRLVLRFYYYGKSLPSFLKKNPSFAMKTSSPVHIMKNLGLMRKRPIPFVCLIAIKLVEYMAYLGGVFSIAFSR